MSGIKKVINIDIISVRPYLTLKNFLIFLLLALVYAYYSKNPAIVFVVALMFSALFAGYPFLVGDESGIDVLYRVVGIDKKEVVCGRYLFALIIMLANIMLGIIFYLVMSMLLNINIAIYDLLSAILTMASIGIFIISLQYPMYFKYGYTKGKTVIMIPFLIFGISVFLLASLKAYIIKLLSQFNTPILIFLIVVMLLATAILSITASIRWYSEREF